MEVALQACDAADWVYKGEGAANLILSYTGSSPSMLGKVMRAKKVLNDKAQPAPNYVNFSSYEQLMWGDIPELIESVKQGSVAQAYAVHVMSQHAVFRELCNMLDPGKPVFNPKKGKPSVFMSWFKRPIIYDVRARPNLVESTSGSRDLQMPWARDRLASTSWSLPNR
ncbi:inositol-pentakisphosphate 2-kinase IPK1 isoform X2 [Triticum aestivum]|uniref:inositol-pentakisphosphate 2-kinase IPK1 isoform X2 n=1 Tax=Triticum aestivum TaxID=4565 RepID=UPI001D00D277|nr:inositol-pentakisphosphate 2-kinase IPK1-like isoform X2 [Triticum aestivum]